MNTKHYLVYQITNLINDKIYIGIHSTENVDDGYMGSGSHLTRSIKKYGLENFVREILFDFDNPEDMIQKECELVDRKFIARTDTYNIALGGIGWNTFDSVTVKDTDGNYFRVHKTDPRYLSGEFESVCCGIVTVRDIDGNTFSVSVNDPRYISGELIPECTGRGLYKDINGKSYCVNTGDPRVISGELFGHNTCNVIVKNNIGDIFMVSKTDPRYLSGELKSFWTGRNHKEETKKKIGEANSISQRGNRNSQFGTCWIYNLELKQNKKIHRGDYFSIEDGWSLGRKIKF